MNYCKKHRLSVADVKKLELCGSPCVFHDGVCEHYATKEATVAHGK
jgi:hypothetical protein